MQPVGHNDGEIGWCLILLDCEGGSRLVTSQEVETELELAGIAREREIENKIKQHIL